MVSRVPSRLLVAVFVLAASVTIASNASRPAHAATQVSIDRKVESVVMPGSSFPTWSAGPEVTFRRPQVLMGDPVPNNPVTSTLYPSDCADEPGNSYDPSTDHSCSNKPDVFLGGISAAKRGAPVDRILGYKWNGSGFQQIPLQVDERFIRYLSNNASGFAFFSGVDQHLTYAFDRETFRYTDSDPSNPCLSAPHKGIVAEKDPIPGLDDNDEISFQWQDSGTMAAPSDASLPTGIKNAFTVRVDNPQTPLKTRYVYLMLAKPSGPRPEFTAANGYVHYERDADADIFRASESSYDNYGNAPKGPYFDDATGTCVLSPIKQRRPSDKAWITTSTYRFRYEGRWLMTELHIRQGDGTYGPDVIDRWKARAFAQDPGSETPCCGYEEEDTNWGGSSILFGERTGPVRAIRETWGADSGTNVIRRETFYRDKIDFASFLRVHVIPPLDGIYTQWDYNAGRMTKYYNPQVTAGVPIDGQGDEVFGNLDDPCNAQFDGRGDQTDATYRQVYKTLPLCNLPYHQSVDVMDPTFSAPGGTLQWEQISGPSGSLVDRWQVYQPTPGGLVQGVVALPYYRDDSCFDDGTGTDPGPKMHLRNGDEPMTYTLAGPPPVTAPRRCWTPTDGLPDPSFTASAGGFPNREGDERYVQGDIGAHGLHLMFLVESDNASTTVPITEIDAVQHMTVLRGADLGNVGDRYGRATDVPLVLSVSPRP